MSDTYSVTDPAPSDMQAVIDTAIESTEPASIIGDRVRSVVVPAGAELRVIDTEQFEDQPRRKRGSVTLADASSMAAYVNRYKTDAAMAYVDHNNYRAVAVLDDHTADVAGWADHTAVLQLEKTPEWSKWLNHNERMDGQEDFAELIEDRLDDIVDPPGAELLEMAQNFHATTKVEFRESRILANGQRQLLYSENVDARGGSKGELTIPKEFTLGVVPFEGSSAYKITARLRFKIRDGRLTIGYVLKNPRDIERNAFADVILSVKAATDIEPLYGVRR